MSQIHPVEVDRTSLAPAESREGLLESELMFYQHYAWCLNPYPTVREAVEYLEAELDRLGKVPEGWQRTEVMTNIYLLSCAVLNAIDDYLRGKTIILPRKLQSLPFVRSLRWTTEKLSNLVRKISQGRTRAWREKFQPHLDAFLTLFVGRGGADLDPLLHVGKQLLDVLHLPLPGKLQAEHTYFPSAFRKHDLTHPDVLALGRNFVTHFPDRQQPLLIIGLRTAGSYFAPILRAFLKAEGYQTVAVRTIRPEKGLSKAERMELTRAAQRKDLAVILDDSPRTGDTIVLGVGLVRKAGFPANRVVVLVPVHPASRDWKKHTESLSLADTLTLCLDGEQWHKNHFLDPQVIEARLAEYFHHQGFSDVAVVASPTVEELNNSLHRLGGDPRQSRLKRIFQVQLQTPDGQEETRYVLAKSVGWGWLGYHAFLAGHHLADFVPPVLGLRDGILYSEWLLQSSPVTALEEDREDWILTAASYVAARARLLGMRKSPMPSLAVQWHHDSFRLLERVLSKAYGGILTSGLMRPRVRHHLAAGQSCPLPTLIDGKMHPSEWARGPQGMLKTDYEHHGMGKNELNVIDPAYDLAETILHLSLSADEESQMLRRYQEDSGDTDVESRLFLYKLLAGLWSMSAARKALFRQPMSAHQHEEYNQQLIDAWHFLTVQTARWCGQVCQPAETPAWGSPLVVLDIDGVLDRRIFGFPSTTAAGIGALALLHAHGFALAVDTARSAEEVKEYCRAYGLVGGVAEYGAYAWDAVGNCGQVLLSPEALDQLDRLRTALRRLPGVYLDSRHHYSIRAYTYEPSGQLMNRLPLPGLIRSLWSVAGDDITQVPLPTLTVQRLLAELELDRLTFLQTTIDTTITAREANKGTGLRSLLGWVGRSEEDTIAVGDSESDLPMFQVARRSFAPGQISCRRLAQSLGCTIVRESFQSGLLRIARLLIHSDRRSCPRCSACEKAWPRSNGLVLELLQAADRKRLPGLLRALLDPRAYQIFMR